MVKADERLIEAMSKTSLALSVTARGVGPSSLDITSRLTQDQSSRIFDKARHRNTVSIPCGKLKQGRLEHIVRVTQACRWHPVLVNAKRSS